MVARGDIVAVLRTRIVRSSRINRTMMDTARGRKEIIQLGGSRARSVVVSDDCIYVSPVTPATVARRVEEPTGLL